MGTFLPFLTTGFTPVPPKQGKYGRVDTDLKSLEKIGIFSNFWKVWKF